jgi:uncharacterized membrane protein
MADEKQGKAARPVIKIPFTDTDYVFEAIAVIGIICGIVAVARAFPILPARIPTHFGASGVPNGWGSKNSLWFVAGLNAFLYAAFLTLSLFPQTFNYPVKVTEENAERLYRRAIGMLRWLRIEVAWTFAFMIYRSVQVAFGSAKGLGGAFLYVVVALVLVTTLYWAVEMVREKG